MYNIEETRNLLNRTLEMVDIINELYSEEDEYLAAWLYEGIPDGSSIDEIVALLNEDNSNYNYYYHLASCLLKEREGDRV